MLNQLVIPDLIAKPAYHGGDLCIINRAGNRPGQLHKNLQILPACMKYLGDILITHQIK